jgi:tRNA pseudouridine38-40 synthase
MTLFDPEIGGPAALTGPLVRVRMTVAYDGGPYRGFALQPGHPTVAAVLGEALERVVSHAVTLTCAGRTDAGVHAWGQVVHVDLAEDRTDVARLQRSLNGLCSPTLVVRDAVVVPADFDARFSAVGRRYRYTVVNRPVSDPFLAATAWWVEDPLDLRLMRMACDPLIGLHDFRSFCRRRRGVTRGPEPVYTRRVFDAGWEHDEAAGDGVLRFWIGASAFCQSMVRSIVGTLVDVGLAKRTPGDITTILRAGDRALAGPTAPAHGLCLWHVDYPSLPVGDTPIVH